MARDYTDADLAPAVRGLCDWAVKVTRDPWNATEEDVEGLRALGWSDEAIHDALQVVAYFNYINRIADGIGIDDEPEWEDEANSAIET